MRLEDINDEFKEASFELYYWFSRFEFVLKKQKCLKRTDVGDTAEACWDTFRQKYSDKYQITEEAKRLIEMRPERQILKEHLELNWRPAGMDHCNNDLCKVVTMLTTVRNNLFHGGKDGNIKRECKKRNLELVRLCKVILDQFAEQFTLEEDYTRYY